MKVSELTAEFLGSWLGYITEGQTLSATDRNEITAALASAKSRAVSYTSMPLEEMDEHEDITLAIAGLVNDYLTNNRPEAAKKDMNDSSAGILGAYCRNLL